MYNKPFSNFFDKIYCLFFENKWYVVERFFTFVRMWRKVYNNLYLIYYCLLRLRLCYRSPSDMKVSSFSFFYQDSHIMFLILVLVSTVGRPNLSPVLYTNETLKLFLIKRNRSRYSISFSILDEVFKQNS